MKPTVVLHSGQSIPIQKVMLFDEVAVAEIFRLRTEAAKVLGPSGMAVGVFGTPSLALAAEAAALGVLSGLVAAAAQKSALDRLEAARKKAEELRGNGIWIDVEGISNLEFPAPETWYGIQGMRRMNVDISGMSKEQKKEFLRKHGVEYEWGMGTLVTVDSPIKYIHSGDDFLRVQADQGPMFFRWSHVCSYSYA